jgi:hypothetical protein
MKLYTEEQVITIVIELLWNIKTNNNDTFYNRETIKDSLVLVQEKLKNYKLDITPIELPSDEEIKSYSDKYSTIHEDVSDKLGKYLVSAIHIDGAKWLKEQILNQNK